MTSIEAENLKIIRAYIASVGNSARGEELAQWYTEDAIQIEFPNKLNPNGGQSDLVTLLKRAEMVPNLLQKQGYEIHSAIAQGSSVAIQATWTGVLAVPVGTLIAGDTMKAHFAIFFELREGRIYSQKNYDCFEPW